MSIHIFFIYWPFVILNISSHLCVLRHLYPQAIPGDPDFSPEEKDGEVKYEIITDWKHGNAQWGLYLIVISHNGFRIQNGSSYKYFDEGWVCSVKWVEPFSDHSSSNWEISKNQAIGHTFVKLCCCNEQLFLEIDLNHIDAYLGCRFITMDMQVQESVTILDSSPSSKTNSTRQILSLTIVQRAKNVFFQERVGSPNSLPMGQRRKGSLYPQRQEQDSFLRWTTQNEL